MGDELGGHILSGHVMTTARILQRTPERRRNRFTD